MEYPNEANNYLYHQVTLLADSYKKLIGVEIMPNKPLEGGLAKSFFYAPFVIVSHNTEIDPIFNYANLAALNLFQFSWDEFTQLPSRLSAEALEQSERNALLAEVNQKGYIGHYQGVRITKTGRRFLIKNAVVWNVFDPMGRYQGQAACFKDWEFVK